MLPRADGFHSVPELRPGQGHVVLKGGVDVLQLLLHLGLVLLRDLPDDVDGPLVLPCGHEVGVDLVLVEEPLDIRHVRHDADAADDRKGRGADRVGDRGHHVPPGSRDRVDAAGEVNAGLSDPHQLGGRQPVLRDGSPGGVDRHHAAIVSGLAEVDHEGGLLSQELQVRHHHVAVKDNVKDHRAVPLANLADRDSLLEIALDASLQLFPVLFLFFHLLLGFLAGGVLDLLHVTHHVEPNVPQTVLRNQASLFVPIVEPPEPNLHLVKEGIDLGG
mmetsp:Transcript_20254/g.56295  ORF Transcript_20254/g.56295 Transcript_20254/m.56295 type:complete len:274 (-) Transcript_20254:948-1769(-)